MSTIVNGGPASTAASLRPSDWYSGLPARVAVHSIIRCSTTWWSAGGDLRQRLVELLGLQGGQEAEPAQIHAEHGPLVVAHLMRGPQDRAVAAEHDRQVDVGGVELGGEVERHADDGQDAARSSAAAARRRSRSSGREPSARMIARGGSLAAMTIDAMAGRRPNRCGRWNALVLSGHAAGRTRQRRGRRRRCRRRPGPDRPAARRVRRVR